MLLPTSLTCRHRKQHSLHTLLVVWNACQKLVERLAPLRAELPEKSFAEVPSVASGTRRMQHHDDWRDTPRLGRSSKSLTCDESASRQPYVRTLL